MRIEQANIRYNENGTPVADSFDDVYFSNQDGIAETRYVFIEGNRLTQRWQAANGKRFCIGETGFGTGLNFLSTFAEFVEAHNSDSARPDHLHYISTEKFPLSKADLAQALDAWPQLAHYSEQLLSQYPIAMQGLHRLHFRIPPKINSGCCAAITLDLYFGDAQSGFDALYVQPSGNVDAWFLDGFAPSKNDSMWTPALFSALARLSKPQASFATFTAAGAVKRGLQAAGFEVTKQKGFGRKRDMLVGKYSAEAQTEYAKQQAPIFHRHCTPMMADNIRRTTQPNVAVVGAGIAGAIMALKLVQQGSKVSLFYADDTPAQGASGNDQGGFYPQLNAEAGINSQIHAHSFLYARRFYDELLAQGGDFSHQWCGVLQLAFNEKVESRQLKLIKQEVWPQELVSMLSAEQASNLATLDIPHSSLYMPLGGWISPPELVNACIDLALKTGNLRLSSHSVVSAIYTKVGPCAASLSGADTSYQNPLTQDQCTYSAGQTYCAITANGHEQIFDACVLACGSNMPELLQEAIPFRLTRGQVEKIPTSDTLSKLSTVLCHKGYMTPQMNGFHALGSTYVKGDTQREYRDSEGQQNLAMHQQAMQGASWMQDLQLSQHSKEKESKGRAAIRCSTPDHLPVVGSVPLSSVQREELGDLYKAKADHHYPIPSVKSQVYVLSGLGSRGLTTAPLMAELLVSQICGKSLPLPNTLANALNPNRFLIRDLIRRQ